VGPGVGLGIMGRDKELLSLPGLEPQIAQHVVLVVR